MADEISGKALADLKAQQAEQVRDRAGVKAPTTKTSMGEGRLFGSAGEDEQAAQNRREINRLPAKKMARGGGIESRGKTKGKFV
tara:strand:- start:713 stop:964 length:252 start_codon:yes stop_codon:yes gene_type:complete